MLFNGNYYGYGYSGGNGRTAFFVVAFVLALIACAAAYFVFFSPKSRVKFTGFLEWLREFLNFRRLIVTNILKILYVFSLVFCTLYGLFILFSGSALGGFLIVILGNVGVRISYEIIMVIFSIHSNLADVNGKLGKGSDPAAGPEFGKDVTQENK